MTDHSWLPAFIWQTSTSRDELEDNDSCGDLLRDVPVLPATVLGLELLLQETSIDLDLASALVLSDVGATIKILWMTGKEYEVAGDRPKRMQDCLAGLEVAAWFGSLSRHVVWFDREKDGVISLWEHSLVVARYCKLVAESLGDVCPEDAYLVGLLHEIRTIPDVLGWKDSARAKGSLQAARELDRSLPLFVLAALRCAEKSSPLSTWKVILSRAHFLSRPEADSDEEPARQMAYGLKRA